MKTPEEIKKGLENCTRLGGCVSCPYFVNNTMVQCTPVMAAEGLAYIRQLEAKVPKWISVEDRLPMCGERVLITEGSAVFEAYLSISHKWVRTGIGWTESVTHWMPLPEPPEEVRQ